MILSKHVLFCEKLHVPRDSQVICDVLGHAELGAWQASLREAHWRERGFLCWIGEFAC